MAATGTPTPNIGLRIPQGTDPASVADINYNSTVIDQKVGPVGSTSLQAQVDSAEQAMAYVVNGNTAPSGGIPSGKYVYVKNNTNGIATGMYITTAAISSGATVQASSLSACSEGAVNSLNSKLEPIRQEITFSNIHQGLTIHGTYRTAYISGNIVKCYIMITVNTGIPSWSELFRITNNNMKPAFSNGEEWFGISAFPDKGMYLACANVDICTSGFFLATGTYILDFTYLRKIE